MPKKLTGTPDDMRRQASRCNAKALFWLKRGAEFERRARALEKKRDKWEKKTWPEEFCEQCRKSGKASCFLHREQGLDQT